MKKYTFERYIHDFGKHYRAPAEYRLHKQIFNAQLKEIIAHNSDSSQVYRKAVNKFTDMTAAESKKYRGHHAGMSRYLADAGFSVSQLTPQDLRVAGPLPSSVDWRNVTPPILTDVKDQGGCGSCWAFTTTEEVESAVAQATGQLLTLAPQDVVDCTPNPNDCGGTGGCAGCIAELGFEYVNAKGIALEVNYPYQGQTGTCNTTAVKAATVAGYVKLPSNNYTALMTAVATIGPIAVSMAAGSWQSYGGGVFTGCDSLGNDVDIDHAIQLVGYGTDSDSGLDYWIIRNSWGADWGENGYIRIEKHSDGGQQWCATDPSPGDGSGCNGGPPQVTVCGSCGIWYDTCYPTGGSLWPTKK